MDVHLLELAELVHFLHNGRLNLVDHLGIAQRMDSLDDQDALLFEVIGQILFDEPFHTGVAVVDPVKHVLFALESHRCHD